MTYRHINKDDRNQIEILLTRGYRKQEIACVLGFNKSTIYREISSRKGKDGIYRASSAHHKAYVKRLNSKHQGMKIEKNSELKQRIIADLQDCQSPQAISGRYRDISHSSIYKWLYSSWGQKYCIHLCSRRHKKKKRKTNKPKREMIPNAVSIHERPTQGVHLEGDLFVSPRRYGHSVSVALLVEPKSQYLWAIKVPNRKPSTMVRYINNILKDINVDSITWDRGIENKYHEQFNTKSYFCDAHSPWQKPHVENNIGLLRKWFAPKQTDLSCMTQRQLDRYLCIVNSKWRKSRNFKSAKKLIEGSGIIKNELQLST